MISDSAPSVIDRRVLLWLAAFAISGAVLVGLYPDADQQDSGYHYLFARWAWDHPRYFVNVWARPLFTLIYSVPAQLGYPAAKLFTVLIGVGTGWETWRLARMLKLKRAELVIPLLILQPSFYLIFSVVLTETLFALLLVIALRLHLTGHRPAGALVASTLILVRPEGFFTGLLWGVWLLYELRRGGELKPLKLLTPLLLGTGMLVWWAASLALTGDPLWILHNWPSDWQMASRANGNGPLWWYILMLPLIVGPFFLPQFIYGLVISLKRSVFLFGTASFLTLFVAHSIMFSRGWFGSAGYPRYLVCVSPAIAIISLIGWNHLADRMRSHSAGPAVAGLLLSAVFSILYVDIWPYTRDSRAVKDLHLRFRNDEEASRLPVTRLIASQAYMRIVFDLDIGATLTGSRLTNLERIRGAPPGTLIFWDSQTGPMWYHLEPPDFSAAGFRLLFRDRFAFQGLIMKIPEGYFGGPRSQEMSIYYKD
ncbi:MAG: hypothetical protein IPM66_24175 [Acidobacteriota bacterium]|nr:MAG: hypothetical protein IPM66_24175 [Acidobacteriota bacterium]